MNETHKKLNHLSNKAEVVTELFSLCVCWQQHPLYCPERCKAFRCDLTKDDLRDEVAQASVDVATLIFVLSAIHPDKMVQALENIFRVRTAIESPCSMSYFL